MKEYTILQRALAGEPLKDVFVLDGHGHLGLWRGWFPLGTDADSIVAAMDRIGIAMACINGWNCPDLARGNDMVRAAMHAHPGRFIGFACANPSLGGEHAVAELRRRFDEGFRGIKVNDGYDTLPFRDQVRLPEYRQALDAIWEFGAQRCCPILCHGFVTPEIAGRYPEAHFIVAHAGGDRANASRYGAYPNVFLDTASSGTMRGNIEYLISRVGAERVLYGSDLPFANPAYRIGQVIGTHVPDADLRKILGENMARLLKLEGAGQTTPSQAQVAS